ncbi:transposon Ty3-I Gag-Pol polyprotein [Trichonephila clavipes]|nr:transposon Ty3-I Gag-Pol polyprotein [Trichonephila clavipes]
MSTLNLRSGYFQLAISPKDIEKTAFITRNGTLHSLRMPFGLSGAAPNFQRAIDIILKPVIGRFVSVYMDDVIITSPSFKDHLDHLTQASAEEAGWSNRRIGRHVKDDMVVARCWQQWITEGRVYRRGGSGPRNTNDARSCNQKSSHFGTNNILASISRRHLPPSRHPVPSKRETIRRRLTKLAKPTSAKTHTDPTSQAVSTGFFFCRPRAA